MSEDVAAVGLAFVAEENVPLHFCGLSDSGDVERGGGEIDAVQEALVHGARLEMRGRREILRPVNDQRHEQSFLIAELFPTHMRLSVVAEEDNDRVVCEPVFFQRIKDGADLAIQLRRGVEIFRPVLPRDLVIGIIRWNLHLRGIGMRRRMIHAMRFVEVHLRIEWLVRLQIIPLRRVERLVVREKVPVGLAAAFESARLRHLHEVCREVTGIAQPSGQDTHAIGQRLLVLCAVIVRADRGGIHARHEGRATHGAHHAYIKMRVAHAIAREPVEVRRADFLRAVAAEMLSKILRDEPEDVRSRGFRISREDSLRADREQKDGEEQFHRV